LFRRLFSLWRAEVVQSEEAAEPVPEQNRRDRERGQSLVEYSILLVWTCMAMIALIHGAGNATKGAWVAANNDLTQANAGTH
jgi:Flp pilus assembly pilin Flp